MKNVFFVVSYSHLGGAETRAIDIAINLKRNCIPVFIIYGKKNGKVQELLLENKIKFIERKPFNWISKLQGIDIIFSVIKEVFFILRKNYLYKPESIISFCADANVLVGCANIIIQNNKTYWCQVDDFIQWRWKRLFLFTIRNAKNVISVSNFITRQIKKKTGREKGIITIPNSINPSLLKIDKVNCAKVRLSVVGHINKIKNQGFVIKVISDMMAQNILTNIELNIFGAISDSNYWNEIKVNEEWFHYKGYKTKNEVYNNTDILLIPSLTESFSLVLHEGNFFNLNIICSDIEIFKETAISGLNYFKLNDAKDFENNLLIVIEKFKKNNKENNINYTKKYNDYIDSYRKILI